MLLFSSLPFELKYERSIHTCEGLYKVNGKLIHALVHDIDPQCELWHRRFTHLHYKVLPHVRKMVSTMPEIIMDYERVCPRCGKHIKRPFPSSKTKTIQGLQLIHSDLCGTMFATSLDGYLYFIIFVYDFSHKTWIFFF